MKRYPVLFVLVLSLIFGLLSGCGAIEQEEALSEGPYEIRAGVLYYSGDSWMDTVMYLEQAPLLGLTVQGIPATEKLVADDYDVLYLDSSLKESEDQEWAKTVMEFTEKGGYVMVPNDLAQAFSLEYLGMSALEAINGCCENAEYPQCREDYRALQELVEDFTRLYTSYVEFENLSQRSYGLGGVTETAVALVNWDGKTVYSLNEYGDGCVFFTNPMLPNHYSAGSLTMEVREDETAYASTTSSFNRLMLSGFAELAAKNKFGYALERAYGYFGTPSMAWELHYEEINGIENGALQVFSQLCEEYLQIPSYTLIRNSYAWSTRVEAATYLLNCAEGAYTFEMDIHEGVYSTGTHIDAGGDWLTIGKIGAAGSYFVDYPQHTIRAYPQAGDFDGDGDVDIICGSADGGIYYYDGLGYENGKLKVSAAQQVKNTAGEALVCGTYSAPQLVDMNADGTFELLCGSSDGTIYAYAGSPMNGYALTGTVLQNVVGGQVLPVVSDWNGDGCADLLLGSDKGMLTLYYGEGGGFAFDAERMLSLDALCAENEMGDWLAPAAVDWNQDGAMDIAVGTYDGYIAILMADGNGGFAFEQWLTINEMNYKGNYNVKFGNFAVPCFVDLNGDGNADLLCGSQEYGVAYPIDSEYFAFREQMQEQADYVKDHNYYMGIHFYTSPFASAEREAYELEAHKKVMEYYGLTIDGIGVNQHTWRTSGLDPTQTMDSIYDAGFLWQSGFASPASRAITPPDSAETVVSLPFFMMRDGERTLLIQNTSVLMYEGEQWVDLSAKYNMPICLYYHCDFAYASDNQSILNLDTVQNFRETYGYNFNKEDQMMLASAAALHQTVVGEGNPEVGMQLSLGDVSGQYALYDEDVYRSLGVRVKLAEAYDAESFQVDGDVWYIDGNTIVLGLNRQVSLIPNGSNQENHIAQINTAAEVTALQNGAEVQFLSDGMMEVYVQGHATTTNEGWTVQEENGRTHFVKFGSAEKLTLVYG